MESPSAALVQLVGERKSWSNYYLQVATRVKKSALKLALRYVFRLRYSSFYFILTFFYSSFLMLGLTHFTKVLNCSTASSTFQFIQSLFCLKIPCSGFLLVPNVALMANFRRLLPQVQRANWKKLQSFRQKRRPIAMKLRDLNKSLQQQVGRLE